MSHVYPSLPSLPKTLEPSAIDVFFDIVVGGGNEPDGCCVAEAGHHILGFALGKMFPDNHPVGAAKPKKSTKPMTADDCKAALKAAASGSGAAAVAAVDWGAIIALVMSLLQAWLNK